MSKFTDMAFHEERLQDYKTQIRMLEKRIHTLADDAIKRQAVIEKKDKTIANLNDELRKSKDYHKILKDQLSRYKTMTNEPGEIRIMSRLDQCTKPWKPEIGSKAYNLGNWNTVELKDEVGEVLK